jgi:hypothetical protein
MMASTFLIIETPHLKFRCRIAEEGSLLRKFTKKRLLRHTIKQITCLITLPLKNFCKRLFFEMFIAGKQLIAKAAEPTQAFACLFRNHHKQHLPRNQAASSMFPWLCSACALAAICENSSRKKTAKA